MHVEQGQEDADLLPLSRRSDARLRLADVRDDAVGGASTTSGRRPAPGRACGRGWRKKRVTPAVSRPRAAVVRGRRAGAAIIVGTAARTVKGLAAGSIFTGGLRQARRVSGVSVVRPARRGCPGGPGAMTGSGTEPRLMTMTAAVTLSDVHRAFGEVAALDGWPGGPPGRHGGARAQRRRQDDGHRGRGRPRRPDSGTVRCSTPTAWRPRRPPQDRVGGDAPEQWPAQRHPANAAAGAPHWVLRRAGRRRAGRR